MSNNFTNLTFVKSPIPPSAASSAPAKVVWVVGWRQHLRLRHHISLVYMRSNKYVP